MMKKIVDFVFELGHLRRIKHEGWRLAGVERPDSVAEHSMRATQIAYFLAKMEGYENPYKVCTMVAFHDCGECRIGDIHKVANRYIDADEKKAVEEQLEVLGADGAEVLQMWNEVEERSTEAGRIAKDADLVEQAFTAKEYLELGFKTQQWIDAVEERVQTESAKKLVAEMKKSDSGDWWQDLKKF